MARLSFDDYLGHLDRESARLRAALASCDPDARVPGCPDWSATELLGHHGAVLHFWSTVVEQRPAAPDEDEPDRPTAYAALLAFHEEQAARLVRALEAADPADPAWTWSDEQTVGFTFRRQAHEALVHRLDAEQAAGTVTPLDPALAADGVEEALDVMFGGKPPWGAFTPSAELVRVRCTDTDDTVWVRLGRFRGTSPSGQEHDVDDIAVVTDPGSAADVTVAGRAEVLDAWLWRRGDGAEVGVEGDRAVFDRFRSSVDHPID